MSKLSMQEIKNLARKIVAENQDGIHYADLVTNISQQSPETSVHSIQGATWNLHTLFPTEITKPSRGLFKPLSANDKKEESKVNIPAGDNLAHLEPRQESQPVTSEVTQVETAVLVAEMPKKRGRPKGSTNKPKQEGQVLVAELPKKRGRPKGSTNKPKSEGPVLVAKLPKKRGWPKGKKRGSRKQKESTKKVTPVDHAAPVMEEQKEIEGNHKTIYSVEGPFEIPYYQGKAAKIITDEKIQDFWKQNPAMTKEKGCYVFGIQAARGFTPGYVGKATKTFKKEVFAPHKLFKYQQFLANYKKGMPVLFLIVAPTKRGAPHLSNIKKLENYLIQIALTANPKLLNIQGTKEEEWGIAGILRGGKGKPNESSRYFKKMLKIK